MNRWRDWMRQAESDLQAARNLRAAGNWEWCCFACQQAGEKALKAVLEHLNQDRAGHNLNDLLFSLPAQVAIPAETREACARLNRFYIPTRYPDAFDSGAPVDQYLESDAEDALRDLERLIGFCRDLARPAGD